MNGTYTLGHRLQSGTPVSKEEAMWEREFHENGCRRDVGPRGGVKIYIVRWTPNGRCKTWKRDLTRFQLPIKNGLRSYGYLTDSNAHLLHAAKNCPLLEESKSDLNSE